MYDQLEKDDMKLLMTCIVMSNTDILSNKKLYDETCDCISNKIIDKRIEVLNLPIKLEPKLEVAATIWCTNAGRTVAFLIDCLKFISKGNGVYAKWLIDHPKGLTPEKITLTLDDVCDHIYPHGTYTEDYFCDYIDNTLKKLKCDWAEIY